VVPALEGALPAPEHNTLQLIVTLEDSRVNAWATSDGRRHGNKTLLHPSETRLLSSEGKARRWKVQSNETGSSNQVNCEGGDWKFGIPVIGTK